MVALRTSAGTKLRRAGSNTIGQVFPQPLSGKRHEHKPPPVIRERWHNDSDLLAAVGRGSGLSQASKCRGRARMPAHSCSISVVNQSAKVTFNYETLAKSTKSGATCKRGITSEEESTLVW